MVGQLRHRVTLETRTETPDSYGEDQWTYSTLATVWANVQGMRGQEVFRDDQVQADATHKVTIRHSSQVSGVNAKDRIVHGSKTYDIIAPPIDRDGRERFLEILVRERT